MNLASSHAEPEFIIYSFEKDETSKGSPVWHAHGTAKSEAEACRKADALFMSAKFTRIEVRKKCIDSTTGRIIDEPVKVLDSMPSKTLKLSLFVGGAFACVAIAGLIAFI